MFNSCTVREGGHFIESHLLTLNKNMDLHVSLSVRNGNLQKQPTPNLQNLAWSFFFAQHLYLMNRPGNWAEYSLYCIYIHVIILIIHQLGLYVKISKQHCCNTESQVKIFITSTRNLHQQRTYTLMRQYLQP